MSAINAVCVVEMCGTNVLKCEVYTDDAEGKEQAKRVFLACLAENKCEMDDTPDEKYLEEGWYEDANEYKLFLMMSTN